MAFSKIPPADQADWWDNFRELLDDQYEWPTVYVFKFIAPKEHVADLKEVFIGHDIDIKASSKGKYQSVTAKIKVASADDVVTIYKRAGAVEGVISL